MNTRKYTETLPQVRVKQATMQGILGICEAQEMSLADVVRAALDEYIKPGPQQVAVPIVGSVTPINGEYIVLPSNLLGGQRPEKQAHPRGRYLEVETIPPTAHSVTDNGQSVTKGPLKVRFGELVIGDEFRFEKDPEYSVYKKTNDHTGVIDGYPDLHTRVEPEEFVYIQGSMPDGEWYE